MILHVEIQLKSDETDQKPLYEAKCLFSREHFTSLEHCHTSAHLTIFDYCIFMLLNPTKMKACIYSCAQNKPIGSHFMKQNADFHEGFSQA